MRERVVIVGGGIAGLSAALELSKDYAVTVLEARERFGGRILTMRPAGIPHELGAEFVHGTAPEIWRVIKAAELKTHEVPDRHWKVSGGKLIELPDFWEQLGSVTEEIDGRKRDRSFARLLECVRQRKEAVGLARGFVEGFHAAPVEKASVEAIRRNEESSEEIDGQRQLRVTEGYDRVVEYTIEQCRKAGVQLRAKTLVKSVDWQKRPAKLVSDGGEFEAERVIITLPIGVFKASGFDIIPEPRSKRDAIEALEMGVVCKVVLQFRERFWPERNFGFIHTEDEWFQTWWADERGDVLTAWAGGRAGEKVSEFDRGFAVEDRKSTRLNSSHGY